MVGEQPDLVAGRTVHLRAPARHPDAIARRGRSVDVPPQRRGRTPGDGEGELAEGRRRAGGVAGRPLSLLQQGHHAGHDLRVQPQPPRHDLRHRSPGSADRAGAGRHQSRRRLAHPAPLARRQAPRLHPSRRYEDDAVREEPRDGPGASALERPRPGPAGSVVDVRRLHAIRLAAEQLRDRHLGARQTVARRGPARGDAVCERP
jgi:hypothetical protein